MKLSHSAASRYRKCGKSYELHYIKKLRPTYTSSALLFGDGLDKAYNELLQPTGQDAYELFLKGWTNGLINKNPVYLPTSEKIVYAAKDFDINLLTKDDYQEIDKRVKEGSLGNFTVEEVLAEKQSTGFDKLTVEYKRFFNFLNWLVMKNKAKYMIDGYREEILPRIKKVHAVQKPINADNGNGGTLSGFIDLIADIDDHGPVVLDNKTSAREYEWDSARNSPQLGLYLHMEGPVYNTRKVGFIVTLKNLERTKVCSTCGHKGKGSHKTCDNVINDKRCGGEWTNSYKAAFQVIVNEMDVQFEEMSVEAIDDVAKGVAAQVFVRNTESCFDWYGNPCPYVNFCHKGNKKGLVEEV
jgi:hypothetical protein